MGKSVMTGTSLPIVIILVYIFIPTIQGQCCKMKMSDGKMYNYVKMGETSDFGCMDKCIYKQSSSPGIDYCFKSGGDTMVQCMDDQGNTDSPDQEDPAQSPTTSAKPADEETKPAPEPPGSEPTKPMTGRSCPSRILMSQCEVNCDNYVKEGKCGFTSTYNLVIGSNDPSERKYSWSQFEGSKGDSCSLRCPLDNNLKMTSTCDLIEGKMQWSLPKRYRTNVVTHQQ